MAKAPDPQDIRDVLVQNRAAALSYAQQVGTSDVRQLMELAEQDLLARIDAIKGTGTFTEAHLRAMLMQVRLVTQQLVGSLTTTLADASDPMSSMAAQGTIDYMTQADAAFRGVGTTPLAIREASVFDRAKVGARSSLLARIAMSGEEGGVDAHEHKGKLGVMQRYGMNTIGEFEKVLRVGVLTGKGIDDVKQDLTEKSVFLQGKPAFWAERIARTELMGAYNRASYEATNEINDDAEDMVKILSATFDDRTAADSYAVHGQIRRPEEPFETWYGPMQHPPARPNDREVVVPHRISWTIPRYLKWKTEDEVAARWAWEGRKTEMPPRPLMTTVDLDEFGKEPEKKEREVPEPNEGVQDLIDKGMNPDDAEALLQQYGPEAVTAAVAEPLEPSFTYDDANAEAESMMDGLDQFEPTGGGIDSVKYAHHNPVAPYFWSTFTEAEKDLIGTLSDEAWQDGLDNGKTTDIDPSSVILDEKWLDKHTMKYGIADALMLMKGKSKDPMALPSIIKKDGKLYGYTSANTVAGAALLDAQTMKAAIVDFDDPKIAAQFPSLNKAPEPKPLTAADIMATKTGAAKGSNEGGFYTGADGKKRYVKEYSDPAQAHCENVSNILYKKLGLSAPDSQTFDKDGKTFYAHEIVDGSLYKDADAATKKKAAKQILDGFAADILLGNRDVIGMSNDNVLIRPDGTVHRLDNGGSLLMRARAGRKPTSDLHVLKEWDGFFNSSVNTYAAVLEEAGVKTHADMKKQLVKGIGDILALQKAEGGWDKFIEDNCPGLAAGDRQAIAEMLKTRSSLLEEKLKILKKRVPKPKPVVLEPGKWGPSATTTYEALLAAADDSEGPRASSSATPNGKRLGDYRSDKTPGTYWGDANITLGKHVTTAEQRSITTFTGGVYGSIRAAGRSATFEEYQKNGGEGGESTYREYKRDAENIANAFNKVPVDERVVGTVYRGMKVPRAVANGMLSQNDKPHYPGFEGSMFSTSRSTEPAGNFMRGAGDTYVFMVIKQKSGVAIETISGIKDENEVLMSGHTKFRLTGHRVVKYYQGKTNVLLLELEEADDVGTAEPPKPKRTRKKKTDPDAGGKDPT